MKNQLLALALFLVSTTHSFGASFSIKRMFSGIGKSAATETETFEQSLEPKSTLRIKNDTGNINVSTWNEQRVVIKANKRGSETDVAGLTVIPEITAKSVSISTARSEKTNGIVDYEVTAPADAKLSLSSKSGSITTDQTEGLVRAITQSGSIQISNARPGVKAKTNSGAIRLDQVNGTIEAQTNSGSIAVINPTLVDDGLKLASTRGHITLQLPEHTNASVAAHTNRGSVVCDHEIKLKPRTMKITKKTWALARRDIEGTLGSGGPTILASTETGNVKIETLKV